MASRLRIASATALSSVIVAAVLSAQRGAPPSPAPGSPADATARIVASAQALLTTLDSVGKTKIQFVAGSPQKTRWSKLPTGIFERTGLRVGDQKVIEIMRGDEILRTQGGGRGRGPGRGGPAFGLDEYYLAFIGTPSVTDPWMLQFGGHHLAINLTLAGQRATMAPSLPAAQPATYTFEGRTVRPLGRENDKAFALVNALNASQRTQAILPHLVSDLVLGPDQDGRTIQPEGIRASALTPPQQTMLLEIVREWAGIMHEAFAEPRMAEIRATLPDTWFAWSGPTTNGSAAYFRIQGPTLVIEYAPQGGVDHIHTIYRDPTNDYGAKFARR